MRRSIQVSISTKQGRYRAADSGCKSYDILKVYIII